MGKFIRTAIAFLGSFKLAFVLLALLFWLTFWGTLAQAEMSLYDVQVEYFESIFVVFWIGHLPIPMIGGYLLLSVLFVNLLVGGMLRMRLRTSTIGILICHFGVIFLLVGSYIEFKQASKGAMLLYPGEESNEYQSHNEWEVSIEGSIPGGPVREFVIPQAHFKGLAGGDRSRYTHADLPFDVVLSHYARNATVQGARTGTDPDRVAEGYALHVLDEVGPGQAVNRPGVMVALEPKSDGEAAAKRAVLIGFSPYPYSTVMGKERWNVELRRMRWELPFKIRMKKFVHKKHAGTGMAKEYSSYVTKLERRDPNDPSTVEEEEHHITMNEPLRHEGFTFYQSSWGPQNAAPGAPLFSQFAVVNNPTDKWPEISVWIIAIGLLIHFVTKLTKYLQAESRRQARAGGEA